MNNNNDELKDNKQKVVSNKKETGKISEAKSIIFLPFDLNVSNPEIKEPYTRILLGDSPGKRNKLSDILNDYNKVKNFEGAIKNDKFQLAKSIIDTSKYLDFIANNFNYKKKEKTKAVIDDADASVKKEVSIDDKSRLKNKEANNKEELEATNAANIGFLDWYEKTGNNEKKYILPKNESGQKNTFERKSEFKIEKFGKILNKSARSGLIFIEITWIGEENKLDLLSEIDFFRYHDEENAIKINEVIKIIKVFKNDLLKEISSFITIYKPKEINPDSVELSGKVHLNETEIAEIGFCLSKINPPTISDKVTTSEWIEKEKIVKVQLKNLEQNTTYNYCTYFIDITGKISYGGVQSFTTSSSFEEIKETSISKIIKENYVEIYNLIYFNHVKPTVVHLIKDSDAFGRDNDELSKVIYKTLRIPANINNDVYKRREIKYSEIVNLQSPDENISFATMNEGVLIIDNSKIEFNALTKKYLPAFVLALNQREFLLKVIRLAPYVDLQNLQELKDLKKFVTEVYLKQISFTVSVYNEIDLLFSELQKKFDIETLMKDNKESINEIHQLIEGIVEEEKKVNDNRKNQNLNIFIIALTLIQALSIFYTLFNDLPEKSPYLFELFLSINLLIIFISFIWFIRFNFPTSEPNNLNQNNDDNT